MTFRAAGLTDVGSQRLVNEDRFHVDAERGIFIVVDGIGGQAAGGRAADTAIDVLRARLANGNGPAAARLRDAIAQANNEVHRQAASRPEWNGMACVLTAAVIDGDRTVIGHVGDTRLYKIRRGLMQKLTADHSPVGEREDAGEISEFDAMRHPRRNEIYRDVGSEPHEAGDPDFVEIRDTTLEPDAALLICSDGLTDLVPSHDIQRIVHDAAGEPDRVARALVEAANHAGGRDNVTVVYVEGDAFRRARGSAVAPARVAGPGAVEPAAAPAAAPAGLRSSPTSGANRWRIVLAALLVAAAGLLWAWRSAGLAITDGIAGLISGGSRAESGTALIVRPGESIATALRNAPAGATVLVEPGEYRERLTISERVRLISLTPRAAVLRLPGDATDSDVAVTLTGAGAELAGFRIVGDAATPLGVGVAVRAPGVRLIDLEVTGAARVAIDIGPHEQVMLLASDIHGNPGSGLSVRAPATVRVAHSVFTANAASPRAPAAMVIDPGATVTFVNGGATAAPGPSRGLAAPRGGPAAPGRGRQ